MATSKTATLTRECSGPLMLKKNNLNSIFMKVMPKIQFEFKLAFAINLCFRCSFTYLSNVGMTPHYLIYCLINYINPSG